MITRPAILLAIAVVIQYFVADIAAADDKKAEPIIADIHHAGTNNIGDDVASDSDIADKMPGFGIVAVVGDRAISTVDLLDRAQLMIGAAGLSPTPEIKRRILPQALKKLIDEQLQLREAERRNITISDEEVADAIASIEAKNGRPPGSLRLYMERQSMPWRAFVEQTRAQLIWSKLMAKIVRPRVSISEAELQLAANNKRFQYVAEEVNITPLILPVEEPGKAKQVEALAERLVAEIKAGAKMEEVVRQFMGVSAGEEPNFWVPISQLEPALINAIEALGDKTGIVGPVRTARGYHIVRVNDRRSLAGVNMEDPSQIVAKEVLMRLDSDASPKQVRFTLEIANQVAQNPGTCLDESIAGFTDLDSTDISVSFIKAPLNTLPEFMQGQLRQLRVGEVGEPFATPEGIRFYMLCEKVSLPVKVKPDDRLRETLFREKMELEAAKFMRNLKRNTFIEVRI